MTNNIHMKPQRHIIIALGAVLSFCSVTAGAFGAHGARPLLSEKLFSVYETAVEYQFYHSIALLVVGVMLALPLSINEKYLKVAVVSFLLGILLFSGSLYLYAFTGMSKLGMITPVGGFCFLVGWLMIALSACSTSLAKR
ncbi:DUF423 domain-containing protein [Alkalimarinus alittae]|uniref:DUF423 domain-containing protein n=1 Tax=Alkalimarinus alittae TaxID=2961619 RepID=A0ABY6N3W3_9ALTE|nr:DUF423 domain-containing protein [Alkalimarinus alittae]UZE96682.1 DUF423 domain-containing protein [Alkalimarinus alittae]